MNFYNQPQNQRMNSQHAHYRQEPDNAGTAAKKLEQDPRFKNLMPLKRKIILELANGSTSKSMEQMLPEIMQLNRELQKRNLSFSKEESNLIMDIMMEQASPADRQKIAMLRSMM